MTETLPQIRRPRAGLIARWRRRALLSSGAAAAGVLWIAVPPQPPTVAFPDGHKFAFSIIDDTDMATIERLRPVYEVLHRYGLRTTKTVWVFPTSEASRNDTDSGDDLSKPVYREFIVDLQQRGFEIALHGVRGGSSTRDRTLAGLEAFRESLGRYPRMHINHSLNEENLYWGHHRYGLSPLKWAMGLMRPYDFTGHEPGSAYFWGDVATRHVQYVRRFTYSEINALAVNPEMPYRLDDKPYVNHWFSTANGDRVIDFIDLLTDENLDRLEREGGVCIVYAHLGAGSFNHGSGVHPGFEERVRAVARRNGWFVPASQILDHLKSQPSWTGHIGLRNRIRLDVKYVLQRAGS